LDSYATSSKTTPLHHPHQQEQSDEYDFHDAIEPDVIQVMDIKQVQQQLDQHQHLHVSDGNNRILRRVGSSSSSVLSVKSIASRGVQQQQPQNGSALIDDSFGFSQCDTDGRNLLLARVTRKETNTTDNDGKPKKKTALRDDRDSAISDTSSIRSHNFGDKNFAFRWINESFEEVALSHPSLDRMIGLVVSPQTRILVRAVVKMMNAFVSASGAFIQQCLLMVYSYTGTRLQGHKHATVFLALHATKVLYRCTKVNIKGLYLEGIDHSFYSYCSY
jgi:hypothetical protein